MTETQKVRGFWATTKTETVTQPQTHVQAQWNTKNDSSMQAYSSVNYKVQDNFITPLRREFNDRKSFLNHAPPSPAVACCAYQPACWLCVRLAVGLNDCRYRVVLLRGIVNLSLLTVSVSCQIPVLVGYRSRLCQSHCQIQVLVGYRSCLCQSNSGLSGLSLLPVSVSRQIQVIVGYRSCLCQSHVKFRS